MSGGGLAPLSKFLGPPLFHTPYTVLFSEAVTKLGFTRNVFTTAAKIVNHPVNIPIGNFDTKI